ncbi:MAG: ABC-F family ATP-binding cassette domain-containing protein [Thermomicrobiales bacterium]
MTTLIQAANVSYAHGGNEVFAGVDFQIDEGDRVALIGENGAGKSTLFRLLARQIAPHEGEVTHRRNLVVGYLEQEPSARPGATVLDVATGEAAEDETTRIEKRMRELEDLMGTSDPDEFERVMEEYADLQEQFSIVHATADENKLEDALTGLGIGPERWDEPYAQLSGGEKKLVGLARLLSEDADVLLLDEPDNHLDYDGKRWLEAFMKSHRGAVAIISHDRYFLDRAVNKIFELEDGLIHVYHSAYTGFLQEKRERLEREAELRALREREMKQIKRSAERLTEWARQNPKFAKRAGNRWRILEIKRQELASKPRPILERRTVDIEFNARRGSKIVVNLEGIAKSFNDGAEQREVFSPFDLLITHGERVGVVGPNGAGKTTLFKLLLGDEEPTSGTIRIGPSCKIGYYSQEQETLDPNKTPVEIVRGLRAYSEPQALGFLAGLLFEYEDANNKIRNLSGGEKARLQIAALMLQGANFLMLDEPTNNLDIPSCEELEAALQDFDGTILTISHDRYFLDKLVDRIVELNDGMVRDYPGGFSYFDSHQGQGRLLTTAAV